MIESLLAIGCMGENSVPWLHNLVKTVQTLKDSNNIAAHVNGTFWFVFWCSGRTWRHVVHLYLDPHCELSYFKTWSQLQSTLASFSDCIQQVQADRNIKKS